MWLRRAAFCSALQKQKPGVCWRLCIPRNDSIASSEYIWGDLMFYWWKKTASVFLKFGHLPSSLRWAWPIEGQKQWHMFSGSKCKVYSCFCASFACVGSDDDNVLWIAMAGTHQIWALFLADGKLPKGRWETCPGPQGHLATATAEATEWLFFFS